MIVSFHQASRRLQFCNIHLVFALFLLGNSFFPVFLQAQDALPNFYSQTLNNNRLHEEAYILWEQKKLLITLRYALESEEERLLTARVNITRRLRTEIFSVLYQTLLEFPISSRWALRDFVKFFPDRLELIEQYTNNSTLGKLNTQTEFNQLSVNYTVNLFPFIINLFYVQGNHEPRQNIYNFDASVPLYTGLVIFVPPYGTHTEEQEPLHLETSLYPLFYSEDQELIFDAQWVDQQQQIQWGPLLFVETTPSSLKLKQYQDRIGQYPLKILASGVMGTPAYDLVIPLEALMPILHASNIANLYEGRILIFWEPQDSDDPSSQNGN